MISDDYFSANYKERYNKEFLFDYPINTTQLAISSYWSKKEKERLTVELSKDYKEFIAAASSFAEYTECLVGPLISKHFFTIYPEKVWEYLQQMLPDWAPKRIRRTNVLEPFFGDQYAGVSSKGTGYLFEQMAKTSSSNVGKMYLNTLVSGLEHRTEK